MERVIREMRTERGCVIALLEIALPVCDGVPDFD
jgi:hypothetical protein